MIRLILSRRTASSSRRSNSWSVSGSRILTYGLVCRPPFHSSAEYKISYMEKMWLVIIPSVCASKIRRIVSMTLRHLPLTVTVFSPFRPSSRFSNHPHLRNLVMIVPAVSAGALFLFSCFFSSSGSTSSVSGSYWNSRKQRMINSFASRSYRTGTSLDRSISRMMHS